MRTIEERVESLEAVLGQFIVHTDIFLNRLERDMREMNDRLEKNIREMNDRLEKNIREVSDRLKENIREMNKQWGALANKMGTIDEDLIAPAARPVVEKYFETEPTTRAIRVSRRLGSENLEVDVLVVCEDKVFMIEVKSSPKIEYVEQILEKTAEFRRFFPEYESKQVIPIYAGIIFPNEVINHATQKGLYVMAYREWEYMDIINFDDIKVIVSA